MGALFFNGQPLFKFIGAKQSQFAFTFPPSARSCDVNSLHTTSYLKFKWALLTLNLNTAYCARTVCKWYSFRTVQISPIVFCMQLVYLGWHDLWWAWLCINCSSLVIKICTVKTSHCLSTSNLKVRTLSILWTICNIGRLVTVQVWASLN